MRSQLYRLIPVYMTSLIQVINVNYRRKTHGMQLEMPLVIMEVRLITYLAFVQSLPCSARLLIILKQNIIMSRLSLAVTPINFE